MADLTLRERRRLRGLAAGSRLEAIRAALARHRPYLAGGSVRDALLARRSADLDLTVAGDAADASVAAARLAEVLQARPHLLGRPPRAVWRVESASLKVELWPLGSLSPEDDARRRDLTVNAMLWRLPDGPLVDPTGGLDDLRSGCLRATSREALADDPVRLLRAARFLAQLAGFHLDPGTEACIRELAPAVADAPRERVGHELLLLAGGEEPGRGARALLDLGLLQPAAPPGCVARPAWLRRHLEALARLGSPARHPVPGAVREAGSEAVLALLLRGLGADGEGGAECYAWDRDLRSAALAAARHLDAMGSAAGGPAAQRRELVFRLGAAFPAAIAAAAAGDGAECATWWRRWWRMWRERGAELVDPLPLISAEEVRELAGPIPGPELGRLLRAVRQAQVRGEVRSAGSARRLVRRLCRP